MWVTVKLGKNEQQELVAKIWMTQLEENKKRAMRKKGESPELERDREGEDVCVGQLYVVTDKHKGNISLQKLNLYIIYHI